MTILTNQGDGVVIEDGHNYSTAWVLYDLPLVSYVTFLDRIDGYVEDTSPECGHALENLRRVFVGTGHLVDSLRTPCCFGNYCHYLAAAPRPITNGRTSPR